ncbi:CPBP family intramembrane metalloprotease [Nocardia colli]|uniref:CPBP family intramembrane metalloprotease n=1 Tax=Nocardia colli TaxID=2545717 RepID=A0A5N0ECQ5_9NOCA|nr:CPBP family glutamic-type intramembrane protease [Nocardia colli]KAA8887212.1 CPBP family intramembrane metalloprotease [Nocardia colli]
MTSPSWAVKAWILQIAAFILTFGAPTVVAVVLLITRTDPDWTGFPAHAYRIAGWTAFPFAALALWAAHRWLGLTAAELGLRAGRPVRAGFFGAMGAGYLTMWLGLVGLGFFPDWVTGADGSPIGAMSAWDGVAWSARAGLVEETMLLALPMAIMLRLRWSWPAQLAVLMALRLPFHLYYGPAALLMVAVWCALLRYAYLRVQLIWPFIAAHVLYDLNVAVVPLGPLRAVITLAMLVLGVLAFASWWRERGRHSEQICSPIAIK